MISRLFRRVFGSRNERLLSQFSKLVDKTNSLEDQTHALSDAKLRARTGEFRQRLQDGESLEDLLPEAFATVPEAGIYTLAIRPLSF